MTLHPRACSSFGFCLHEPGRHALPVTDEASQIPCKELLHVHKVYDCARFSHTSQYAMGDIAFSSAARDRHLGIRPVSQLNTWPVVSPVNASRRPSRDAAHHSGLGRLARPFPWGTFTSYSLPAYLAHAAQDQKSSRSGSERTFDGKLAFDRELRSRELRGLCARVGHIEHRENL